MEAVTAEPVSPLMLAERADAMLVGVEPRAKGTESVWPFTVMLTLPASGIGFVPPLKLVPEFDVVKDAGLKLPES